MIIPCEPKYAVALVSSWLLQHRHGKWLLAAQSKLDMSERSATVHSHFEHLSVQQLVEI
jgi:hypothetical protein